MDNSLAFGNIEGINELLSPELLKPTEVPTFINGVLNTNGGALNATTRGAWRRSASFPATASDIKGLKQLLDGLGNPYWCAVVGTKLQFLDTIWNDVKTGLTTGLNFKFVRYNDYNIISNGVDALYIIGGTAFANVRNLEIDRPVITGVSVQHIQGSGGNLTAQTQYRYILVYASDTGDYSAPSQPITHYTGSDSYSEIRNSIGATEKALYLHNLPISSDGRVTRRFLFRTEGNGQTYYLRKILDNVDTFYEDSGADTDLDSSMSITYINVPVFGKHIAVHRDRLFVADLKYKDLNVYEPVHTKNKGTTTTPTRTDGTTPPTYEDGEVMYVFPSPHLGGNLQANSLYKYRVDFIDNYGRRSLTYAEAEYQIDTTVYSYYTLYHIPECNIGAAKVFNPECYTKRIWRTEGDGNVFYLLATLKDDNTNPYAGSTGLQTGYQDNTSDATLITGEVWTDIGSTQQITNPVALAFSDVGSPSVIPLENYREIFADEGGQITGIFDDVNGLLIFKTKAIFKLYTDGSPVNWRLVKLVNGVGCSDAKTIAQIDNTFIFKDKNRFYEFNSGGQLIEIGKQIRTTIESIATTKEAILNNDWYWLLCSTLLTPFVLVYNRTFNTWYKFTKAGGDCLAFNNFGSDFSADTSIFSNYGAYVVYYTTGSKIDNETGSDVDVSMTLHSKYFRFPDAITKARLRKLFINYYGRTGKSVSLSIFDPETNTTQTFSLTASAGWQTVKQIPTTLLKTRKLQFKLSGAGLIEFNSIRLDYRQINEGYGR